jgi:predicted HicB family RNase H-like nuclease
MERKKTGRPSKGERTPINFRVPPALHIAAKKHAEDRGMTLNDFLGELLAEEVGVPYQIQEGLPLTKAS